MINSEKFYIVSEARNAYVTFVVTPQLQINSFQNQNQGYPIHTLSDKVVNEYNPLSNVNSSKSIPIQNVPAEPEI